MKASKFVGGRYLSTEDLKGKSIRGEILSIGSEEVKSDEGDVRERIVIDVEGTSKPFVLNSTNVQALAEALGDETDDWLGQVITIFVDPNVKFAGKKVPGLRVKSDKSASVTPPSAKKE